VTDQSRRLRRPLAANGHEVALPQQRVETLGTFETAESDGQRFAGRDLPARFPEIVFIANSQNNGCDQLCGSRAGISRGRRIASRIQQFVRADRVLKPAPVSAS
jgi:hypothetical protein